MGPATQGQAGREPRPSSMLDALLPVVVLTLYGFVGSKVPHATENRGADAPTATPT